MTKTAGKTALKPKTTPAVTAKTSSTSVAPVAAALRAPTPAPVVAAAPATAPAPVVAAPVPAKPVSQAPTITTIDVKLDVGFGNAVFVRGQGNGLTWERGVPLICVDGKTWRWSGEAKDPITFKVLINDKIWSAGNDLTVTPGQKLEVAPRFA